MIKESRKNKILKSRKKKERKKKRGIFQKKIRLLQSHQRFRFFFLFFLPIVHGHPINAITMATPLECADPVPASSSALAKTPRACSYSTSNIGLIIHTASYCYMSQGTYKRHGSVTGGRCATALESASSFGCYTERRVDAEFSVRNKI